jgi:hypothetical protein
MEVMLVSKRGRPREFSMAVVDDILAEEKIGANDYRHVVSVSGKVLLHRTREQ